MSTHPEPNELEKGLKHLNELDGDFSERRKDHNGSAYLDDVNAVKAEVARAAVENREPDLEGYPEAALGAAGVVVTKSVPAKKAPAKKTAKKTAKNTASSNVQRTNSRETPSANAPKKSSGSKSGPGIAAKGAVKKTAAKR